jgi:hypothetical protein
MLNENIRSLKDSKTIIRMSIVQYNRQLLGWQKIKQWRSSTILKSEATSKSQRSREIKISKNEK